MQPLSHNPAAGLIGTQLVEIGTRGLESGAAVVMSVTGLIPAGAEEVSAQAAAAFAEEAAAMLAFNTAAQEELMRAGAALTDIARMYTQADDTAAGSMMASAMSMLSNGPLSGGSGAGVGPGLAQAAQALPGAVGSAAGPLMSGLAQAASSPGVQAVASAGTSVASGIAPMASMGQGASAGGASAAGLTSATAPVQDENEDGRGPDDEQAGERVL
jgi:PE family